MGVCVCVCVFLFVVEEGFEAGDEADEVGHEAFKARGGEESFSSCCACGVVGVCVCVCVCVVVVLEALGEAGEEEGEEGGRGLEGGGKESGLLGGCCFLLPAAFLVLLLLLLLILIVIVIVNVCVCVCVCAFPPTEAETRRARSAWMSPQT